MKKRIVKSGVALLQQQKALNADTITLLHSVVSLEKDSGYYRNARLLTAVIKRMAVGQKSTKAAIRGHRTTDRTSKKHARIAVAAGLEIAHLVVA